MSGVERARQAEDGESRARCLEEADAEHREHQVVHGEVVRQVDHAEEMATRYTLQAILAADYKAVLAVTLVVGVIYAIVNILVDLVHGLLDPRVAEQL